jgi:hypothetical protein
MQAVLSTPRTVLKAMEFYAKLTGELGPSRRVSPVKTPGSEVASRRATVIWNTNCNRTKPPGVRSASVPGVETDGPGFETALAY